MLGPAKPHRLDQPIALSLEDLVPQDTFYRHLEAKLDLASVRDWARELSAERERSCSQGVGMRILFSTQAGSGHWRPLIPLAQAVQMAGHEVAFATTPSRSAGPHDPTTPAAAVWVDVFVNVRARHALPDLLAACETWRPDLLVREMTEFAGCVAAERFGIPHAAVQVGAWRPELHALITPGLASSILAALRDEPINLILTVGPGVDPVELDEQPPHVHVERYVPQSHILPFCDLVVCHGGFGTVLTALDAGLPLVIVPITADQPDNARRCAELGVAEVISAGMRTPETIRDAVLTVLGQPGYRRRAEHMREEMRAAPDLAAAVGLLERLASEKEPLLEAR
jgi:UDP:flavonoid glycosyltransferase YjiC (YdhE family)